MEIKEFRKQWSTNHKKLRELFAAEEDLTAAISLFIKQHQVLHSKASTGMDSWSYPDAIFSGLEFDNWREIPRGEEHSLIWILWHISRIEDITMRVLVENADQEYLASGWKEKLDSPFDHPGNDTSASDVISISEALDPLYLLDYRAAVGRNTSALIQSVDWAKLNRKVQPQQLNRLVAEGAVLPQSEDLLAYWGKRTVSGLLLMPPTRHIMVHLNEAWSIKNKLPNHGDRR